MSIVCDVNNCRYNCSSVCSLDDLVICGGECRSGRFVLTCSDCALFYTCTDCAKNAHEWPCFAFQPKSFICHADACLHNDSGQCGCTTNIGVDGRCVVYAAREGAES